MTIIIAVKEKNTNKFILASDSSCSTSENNMDIFRKDLYMKMGFKNISFHLNNAKKHFIVAFGLSGNYSDLQYIKYAFQWPYFNQEEENFMEYLVCKVQPKLFDALNKRFRKRESNWQMLLIVEKNCLFPKTEIYSLDSDGDVHWHKKKYACIGSGSAEALSAMHVLHNKKFLKKYVSLKDKVDECMRITELLRADVRLPIQYINN